MAVKYLWSGESLNVNIANKQQNNSGINSVNLYVQDGASQDDATLSANAIDYFDNASTTNITNKNAGNTTTSVVAFTTSAISNYYTNATSLTGKQVSGTPITDIYSTKLGITWGSGGKSDKHELPEFFVAEPADTVTLSLSQTEAWSDATKLADVTLSISGQNANSNNVFNTSGKVSVSFRSINSTRDNTANLIQFNGGTNTVNAGTTKYPITFSASSELSDSATFGGNDGFAYLDLTPTITGGSPDAGYSRRDDKTGNSVNFKVKNAVSRISLNGDTATSIYIPVGGAQTISYTVVPHVSGQCVYSTALTVEQAPSAAIAPVTATTAPSKGSGESISSGSISFSGKAVGSTTIQFKSTQAATEKKSPVVTIYVTPASTTIYLNPGDKYTVTVPSGTSVSHDVSDGITDANASKYATAAISGTSLTITAGTTATGSTPVKFKLNSGAIFTVNVAHITVTVN